MLVHVSSSLRNSSWHPGSGYVNALDSSSCISNSSVKRLVRISMPQHARTMFLEYHTNVLDKVIPMHIPAYGEMLRRADILSLLTDIALINEWSFFYKSRPPGYVPATAGLFSSHG